jgi:hypothetical protein
MYYTLTHLILLNITEFTGTEKSQIIEGDFNASLSRKHRRNQQINFTIN